MQYGPYATPAAVGASLSMGRFPNGQDVPIVMIARSQTGEPLPQVAIPSATVYDESGEQVAQVGLAPVPGDESGGVFLGHVRLGRDFAWGNYRVVLRGDGFLAVASFAVAGGDVGGNLISLYSHDRPEARYVLGQLSGGSLVQGRDPHF